ncbi:SecE/Sec61-gamma subunits of protein translocation complex [Plasmodiophora brassicae]|uniref:Uncharacterized protein n=2 Tax=Plasmodiophora brassicae TaxID=37360 RepID=A0A3P3YBF2_PLABS|nr:unnamed protein product [Plasmodiophora brassicae]
MGRRQTATFTEDPVNYVVGPLRNFAADSYRLLNKCTKPDAKEFKKIALATSVGFLVMGFTGFFIKLIHIPINNILVGSGN